MRSLTLPPTPSSVPWRPLGSRRWSSSPPASSRTSDDGSTRSRTRAAGRAATRSGSGQRSPDQARSTRHGGATSAVCGASVRMRCRCCGPSSVLGPVREATADVGRDDLRYLVLHHERGATSTATLALSAPRAAAGSWLDVRGEHGISTLPGPADPVGALRVVVSELAANARSGDVAHPCDVAFGRSVTRVLTAAQRYLENGRRHRGYAR